MRPKLSFAWFLLSVGLAALLVMKWRAMREQAHTMEILQTQIEEMDGRQKIAEARVKELEGERTILRGDLRAAEMDSANARAAYMAMQMATNSPGGQQSVQALAAKGGIHAGQSGMGPLLKQMMDNPDMRKMIEAQQKTMVETMYGPLIKQLNLSGEDAEQLKALLLERQMSAVSNAGDLLNPADKDKREAALKTTSENEKQFEEKLKSLLGEDKYGQYKDYTSMVGERMVLNQFVQNEKISPEQQDQLLQIMSQEKKAAIQLNPDLGTQDAGKRMKMLESDEAADEFFKNQDDINARVLERAREILTPEQAESLAKFQKSQQEQQKLGIGMARAMFKGQSAPPPGQTPSPVKTQ